MVSNLRDLVLLRSTTETLQPMFRSNRFLMRRHVAPIHRAKGEASFFGCNDLGRNMGRGVSVGLRVRLRIGEDDHHVHHLALHHSGSPTILKRTFQARGTNPSLFFSPNHLFPSQRWRSARASPRS